MSVNTQELQGQWKELRGKVKEKWEQLTDDDLTLENGNIDQLIGCIERKTGEGKASVERFLGELTAKTSSVGERVTAAAKEYLGTTSDGMRDGIDQAMEKTREGYRRAEGLAKENPGTTFTSGLCLGIGMGFLLAMAVRSRN